jgi:Ca2+-binding EF-hand superfamily protein
MKEHVEEQYIDLDSMDEPQLMAQYFRNFDLDRNGKIDGLELLKSMQKMTGKS